MSRLDPSLVVAAIRAVLPRGATRIELHEPTFDGHEWAYVKECLDTRWVSSAGAFVDRFEGALAAYTGAKHAVAVVNGTAALHICLMLAGVEAADEVIVPTLTFVATANAVSYCGAIPHFVDSAADTLGIDPRKLEEHLTAVAEVRADGCFNRQTGARIRAVVPMHTFGHPVDLDPLDDLCARYRLTLVEDAAESLGSLYKGRHTGTRGLVSALSFNGNKIVTTGGGGAILTNDAERARLAKHLTTTARIAHGWSFFHDRVGYNYRMPNINAALGCAQLEQLPLAVERKRSLAESYATALHDVPGIRFFREPSFGRANYWLNALLLDPESAHCRDELLQTLNDAGIAARPVWTLMHELPAYRGAPRMFSLETAEDIERRLVNIPSSPFLGADCG
jgi:perosamine synthetase